VNKSRSKKDKSGESGDTSRVRVTSGIRHWSDAYRVPTSNSLQANDIAKISAENLPAVEEHMKVVEEAESDTSWAIVSCSWSIQCASSIDDESSREQAVIKDQYHLMNLRVRTRRAPKGWRKGVVGRNRPNPSD
jgi:hypothetical protein